MKKDLLKKHFQYQINLTFLNRYKTSMGKCDKISVGIWRDSKKHITLI